MILDKYLFIDEVDTPLISADIALAANRVGVARFEVRTKAKPDPNSIIQFATDYQPHKPIPYFTGFIHDVQRGNDKKWIIKAYELTHALNLQCDVSLRNCSVKDVLSDLTKNTALNFESPQANHTAARFQNHDNGLKVLELLPRVFKIDDFLWQLSADGQNVYCGSWKDSEWQSKPQEVPKELFDKESSGNRSTITFLPHVRPACVINNRRIQATRFTDDQLKITWQKNTL